MKDKKTQLVKPLSQDTMLSNNPQKQTQSYAKEYKSKNMAKGKR